MGCWVGAQGWRFVGDEVAIKLKREGVRVSLGVDPRGGPEDDDLRRRVGGEQLLRGFGVDFDSGGNGGLRVGFAAPD